MKWWSRPLCRHVEIWIKECFRNFVCDNRHGDALSSYTFVPFAFSGNGKQTRIKEENTYVSNESIGRTVCLIRQPFHPNRLQFVQFYFIFSYGISYRSGNRNCFGFLLLRANGFRYFSHFNSNLFVRIAKYLCVVEEGGGGVSYRQQCHSKASAVQCLVSFALHEMKSVRERIARGGGDAVKKNRSAE